MPLAPSRTGAPKAPGQRPPAPRRALAYVGLAEPESGDLVTVGGEKQCFSLTAH